MRHAKSGLCALVAFVLLLPFSASAGPNTAECRRMTKQIAHFEDVVQMAKKRNNDPWENSTRLQISRLAERRERLCPDQYGPDRNFAAKSAAMTLAFMKAAGKAALKFFTFGAGGI